MPTSMPIYFNYHNFIESLENLQKLKTPLMVGYTHFGVVNGSENVKYMMEEHKEFLKDFRSKVIQYYEEKPETTYVFHKLVPYFQERIDVPGAALNDIVLGVVYGMMLDLG